MPPLSGGPRVRVYSLGVTKMTKQRQSRIALLTVAMLLCGVMLGFVITDDVSADGAHNIDGFVQPNLASVTVTILNSETGDSETTTTEADGYYSFSEVNSGDYLVRFSKSGYLSQLESWEISEGGSMADVTMTEAPSGSGELSGTVTNSSGNVAGAVVSIYSTTLENSWWSGTDVGYAWTATTDVSGEYSFSGLPAETFSVRITSDDHYTFVAADASAGDFSITEVASSNDQNIRVKDTSGNTISDATVFMYDTATSTWTESTKLGGATYVLSPSSGSEIYVYAYHQNHNPSVMKIASVSSSGTFDMVVGENDAADDSVVYISASPSNGAQSSIPKMGDRIIKLSPSPSAAITVTSDYTDVDGLHVVANGEQVNFSASSSSSSVGISQYDWSFATTGAETSNTFTTGSTEVILTVTDTFGGLSTANVTIMADGTNPTPAVDVTVKTGVSDDGEAYNDTNLNEDINVVVFNASGSTDDSGIVSFEWDFGDETTDTGDVVSHVFTDPGSFGVVLTVTDAAGNTASSTTTVAVHDIEAPRAAFTWSSTNETGGNVPGAVEGQPVHFNASGSDDNSGDSLTYIWDFGDGTSNVTGEKVDHTFSETSDEGFNVILEVTDASGNKDQINYKIKPAQKDRPDLYIAGVSFSNENPSEGDVITINATIKLLKMNVTDAYDVTFYLDEISNTTVIGTVEVNETALEWSEGTIGYDVETTWTATAGAHTIYVVVDANNVIDEGITGSNEEKNSFPKVINVKSTDDSRDWTSIFLIVLVVLLAFGAVGYIYRDSLFK